MTKLLNWIDSTPPDWANTEILNWNEVFNRSSPIDMQLFVTREIFESNASLDMRSVVGQWEHYAGQTWLDSVRKPKWKPGKINSCLRLYEENPEYYFNGEVENGISVNSLNDGPWYSCNGGNHRTIIAKFACEHVGQETGTYPMVQGVHKHSYYVNLEAWKLANELQQERDRLKIFLKVNRVRTERTSEKGRVSEYAIKVFVLDFRFGRDGRSGHLELSDFIRYAKWALRSNGELTRADKVRHHWSSFLGNYRGLLPVNA